MMRISGLFVLTSLAAYSLACGSADKLTDRTFPKSSNEKKQGRKVGNRDINAKADNQNSANQVLPGKHSLYFTILRGGEEKLPPQLGLNRDKFSYDLNDMTNNTEPEWKKACPDDCEISAKVSDKGEVMVAGVQNIGFDSFLIGYTEEKSSSSEGPEKFMPIIVVEVVCRECDNFSVMGATQSECVNLRSMWLNGDHCVEAAD